MIRRTTLIMTSIALIAGLVFTSAASAVVSNGKTVPLSVNCSATPGTPGGGQGGTYGGGGTGTVPGTTSGCSGTITLSGNVKKKKKKRHAVAAAILGSSSFTLTPGQSATVSVPLSGTARKSLKRKKKLTATVVVTTASSVSSPQTIKITLKKKKKKKH